LVCNFIYLPLSIEIISLINSITTNAGEEWEGVKGGEKCRKYFSLEMSGVAWHGCSDL
jgi:hypothetical protein